MIVLGILEAVFPGAVDGVMDSGNAEHLVKIYRGGIRAVDGVFFSVHAQEIFGLLGPNGEGKSTSSKCIIELLRPTAGRIRILGVDAITDPMMVKRSVGHMAQEIAADDGLTDWENLRLQGRFRHLSHQEIRTRGEEVLRLFGLRERRDDLAQSRSGGMLKRPDIVTSGLRPSPR